MTDPGNHIYVLRRSNPENLWKSVLQDFIPVGCVPPACWPYPSMHYPGRERGVCPGVGGVCPGGLSAHGYVCGRPPPWTEWQTGAKTLPCRNFVAGGKNEKDLIRMWCYGRVCVVRNPAFCVHLLVTDDLNLKSEYRCRLFQANAKLIGRIFSKVKQRRRICLTRIVTVYSSLYVLLLLTLHRFTRTHCT